MQNTKPEIEFTGERMVPELNQGMTLYYEHLLRYMMASRFVKNKKVLDVGCGVGYGSWMLKKSGASEVYGIDISKDAVSYADKKFAESKLQFEIGDGENLKNYQRNVDVITAFEFIEHIHNQNAFLKGVKENLKPNGLFFVSSPNKNTYQNHNHFHVNELTPANFEQLLRKYFKHVLILDQRFLFTNYIIPTHSKSDINLDKLQDSFVKEKIESILPLNKIEDSRYMIAICSDRKLDLNQEYFSISSYDVDKFSLKHGIEGLYEDWHSQSQASAKDEELLNQIRDSWFFKLWEFYCLIKKTLKGK